jgi:hypothetical protein
MPRVNETDEGPAVASQRQRSIQLRQQMERRNPDGRVWQ